MLLWAVSSSDLTPVFVPHMGAGCNLFCVSKCARSILLREARCNRFANPLQSHGCAACNTHFSPKEAVCKGCSFHAGRLLTLWRERLRLQAARHHRRAAPRDSSVPGTLLPRSQVALRFADHAAVVMVRLDDPVLRGQFMRLRCACISLLLDVRKGRQPILSSCVAWQALCVPCRHPATCIPGGGGAWEFSLQLISNS